MKPLLIPVLWIMVVLSTFGQTKNDTLVAWQHYQKADSLLKAKDHDQSILLFKKAIPIYEKAKAWERVASSYNKVSENQWRSRKLEKPLYHAKKAIDICNRYLAKDHPEVANAFDNTGKYYEEKGNYKSSLLYYQKALTLRKKIFPENHPDLAESYSNIAIYYYITEKNQKAILYFEKALAIYLKILRPEHEKVGNIYNNLGNIYDVLEKYDTALNYYKKDLSITIKNRGKHHLYTAYSYANIGQVYSNLNQLNLGLKYYEKALSIFKKENNTFALMAIYNNSASIFSDRGEKDKALQYYKKALNLTLKLYGDNHPETARIYHNLTYIYDDYDIEQSLSYCIKALQIYKTTFGEKSSNVADIYNNFGVDYKIKEEYDTALTYFHKSLKIRQNILGENLSDIALSYINIGDVYSKKRAYVTALDYYQKSLAILQNSSAKHYNLMSDCYTNIGETHYGQQKYGKALTSFDKAIQYNTKKNNVKTLKNTFDPKHYHIIEKLFISLLGKAKTLQERYKRDKTSKDLDQSITLYQNLDQIVDHLRLSYQNYEDKVSLAEQAKEMYADAITANLEGHKGTNDLEMLEKALYYAGKSKSNILKDLLSDNSAKGFAGLPEDIILLEQTLKSNRAFYQSQLVKVQSKDSVDTARVQEYENKLFEVSRKQDSIAQVLEQDYPKYYQLKHQNTVVSAATIQQKLSDNITVLEFFISDSITYAFTISKNTIAVQEFTVHDLDKKVAALHQSITSKNVIDYKKSAHTLYQELIAPIQHQLTGTELIIIPDGPLWHLNFELLLTKEETTKDAKKLPYLLRDYAISYANSANLLFNTLKSKDTSSKNRKECLAFSFTDSTALTKTSTMSLATLRDTGDDLPGTRKEIKAISEIVDGEYYYGAEAVEANFKQNADQYTILHLALHGEVDDKNPKNSRLYFTKDKDTIEDNLLYSHELFALNIPADLVVLSACNTGTGKIAKGEGIMSLGTAFQYAGTKSLLLSSWEVSDTTTPELMQYFYANLKEGMNKAQALQQAKLKFLTTADTFHTNPFYWGSFYVLGNTDAIDIGASFTTAYLLILIGVVLLVLIFIYFKKKSA